MDRRVRCVKKDRSGRIAALCNPGESWSPRRVSDVVDDIAGNTRSYYVEEGARRRYVRLSSKRELQTTTDKVSPNRLDRLPTC